MKSEMPYHGIKTPQLREIQKRIFTKEAIKSLDEYLKVIDELWDATHREERYCAIALARKYKEYIVIDTLPLYRKMIVTGAWWDYVDNIAAHLIGKLLLDYPGQMRHEVKKMIGDDNLWIRRTAILSQLRFRDKTDEGLLYDFCLRCLHEEVFWIRKAIGWALREYSKVNPDSVRRFVVNNREKMSGLSLREASKYI